VTKLLLEGYVLIHNNNIAELDSQMMSGPLSLEHANVMYNCGCVNEKFSWNSRMLNRQTTALEPQLEYFFLRRQVRVIISAQRRFFRCHIGLDLRFSVPTPEWLPPTMVVIDKYVEYNDTIECMLY